MAESPTLDFRDLLSRAAQGDSEAVDELVRQYEPKIRIVARVLLGRALRPYLDSGDLVQSVHESILVGLQKERFEVAGPEQLIGLAVTVLRRKAAKHWRHLRRQQRLSGAGDAADTAEDRAALLTDLSSPGSDPTAEAQFRDQVNQLCARLDDTERHLIDLRMEGYTPAEIADQLGIGRVALRVRMTRLRQRLHAAGVLTDWF